MRTITVRPPPDTGAYCVAREKLHDNALHDLLTEMARKIEPLAPEAWLWRGRHAKLVDGFTATMPDTPENQAAFPQQKSQGKGLGFPIMRVCMILSLATARILDAACGPYTGKQTGEPALFREIIDAFQPGDVAVFDRYHGSYMTLALLMLRGVDVCTRLHQRRPHDMRHGTRLGKYDRLVTWHRPAQPSWMDDDTYATIPKTITLAISFTETCATLLAAWSTLALGLYDAAAIESLLARIALLEIPERPGRIEPRVLERRRHRYPLMRAPRQTLRKRLKSGTRCHTMT
mgnify:CR=1 FL=1